jgi:DNA-binding LytR/AlgR family response regulator
MLRAGIAGSDVALPALVAAGSVALLTSLATAGDLLVVEAAIPWSGIVFGQLLDSALSLGAFFLLVRWSRRRPIARDAWAKTLALQAGMVVGLALACMTVFFAMVELAAGAGFEGARETAVDLGDELVRMVLLAGLAQLLVRIRPGGTPSSEEAEMPAGCLVIRDGGQHRVQTIADVRWADAQGNYVRLHTPGGRTLMRTTMQELEARLGAAFLRIHRGTIVNLSAVRTFGRDDGGRQVVRLDDGTVLRVGRAHAERLRAVLGDGRSSPQD